MSKTRMHDTAEIVAAWRRCGGNSTIAAEELGISRGRIWYHLKKAGELGGKVAGGRVRVGPTTVINKPRKGKVKRFLFASAQNNTHLGSGINNLRAYSKWLNNGSDTCDLIIGTFSYDLASYGEGSVKRRKAKGSRVEKYWYAEGLADLVKDDPIQIGPGLLWGGNFNALPTAKQPLNGLERFGGRMSVIVPHVKQHLRSVPSMRDEPAKFMYSTGSVTLPNYIQMRAGITAEPEHIDGALLVEVDSDGAWFCRHILTDKSGTLYDLGPSFNEDPGVIRVKNAKVETGYRTAAINVGDVHVREMDNWIREVTWGENGLVWVTQPVQGFLHDIYTQAARNHHDRKNFERRYSLFLEGQESVKEELNEVAAFLTDIQELHTYTGWVVIHSNHDRHLERWLDDNDYREDLLNAKFYLQARLAQVNYLESGEHPSSLMEWALRDAGCPSEIEFNPPDHSLVICKDYDGGIECGLHGDEGPNGAQGTDSGLEKMGRRVNKGHSHVAYFNQAGVGSAGACALNFDYVRGPGSHSASDILTFDNGARQVVTKWAGKFRA